MKPLLKCIFLSHSVKNVQRQKLHYTILMNGRSKRGCKTQFSQDEKLSRFLNLKTS